MKTYSRGKVKLNFDPRPTSDSRFTVPPCCSTTSRTTVSKDLSSAFHQLRTRLSGSNKIHSNVINAVVIFVAIQTHNKPPAAEIN